MESPFTGGKATLVFQEQVFEYRKEKLSHINVSYRCEDTGELFAPPALEDFNLLRIYNQYRALHNIPFPDEIVKTRTMYGLSRPMMSKILGFGEHQLSRYENDGEVPSESNGRILAAIQNPAVFAVYLNNAKNQISEKDFEKISSHLSKINMGITDVYKNVVRGKMNGLGELNIRKATQAALCLIDKAGEISAAKFNAMILYADLYAYVKNAKSITGFAYQKNNLQNIEPKNFISFYGELSSNAIFACDENGVMSIASIAKNKTFDELSKQETEILDYVFTDFSKMNEKQIAKKINQDFSNGFDFDAAFSLGEINSFF